MYVKKFIIFTCIICSYFILISLNNNYQKIKFECKKINKINDCSTRIEILLTKRKNKKSMLNYVTLFSLNKIKRKVIINKDQGNFSLLLLRNIFITSRVIISRCKIISFKGQCYDKLWYKNEIEQNEYVKVLNFGFSLINWHSDGVFHGTIEGLTRIVPYINHLLTQSKISILISHPRYRQNTVKSILQLLGFSKKRILYGHYFVKVLYVPTPFYCVETSTPLIIEFNKLLREKIHRIRCECSTEQYILIIQRTNNRILYNLKELKTKLNYYYNISVITYTDKETNLTRVYCWFTYAKIIIGYHGSGLTNIYFSYSNTTIIELSPSKVVYAFAKIASQLGLAYFIYTLPHPNLYTRKIEMNISQFILSLQKYKIFV